MYLVSRTETFAKLFFVISVTGLLTYIILACYSLHFAFKSDKQLTNTQTKIQRYPDPDLGTNIAYGDNIKYILFWTVNNITIMNYFGIGHLPFIINNCSFENCFITDNKDFLGDYTNFDAIVVELPVIRTWYPKLMPQRRSRKQKYIFRGVASSALQHVCHVATENYFNWTWSYKLYSDIFDPFIEVKDLSGNYIAPSVEVDWLLPSKNENISQSTSKIISSKTKAIAWIMDRCETKVNRMKFAKTLAYYLRSFNRRLDIYGCGHLTCPKEGCLKAIKQNYYFYLVYEHSIADDYVTKEILKAYDNYAIPVVISGADLSKFLPPGSYVDSRDLAADRIATIIDYMISSPDTFKSFHLWRNHYKIQSFPEYSGLCQLCAMLNNQEVVKAESVYTHFRKWWFQGSLFEVCAPKSFNEFNHILSYVNESVDYLRTKKRVKIEV